MEGLFHIPHASTNIPEKYLKYFRLNSNDLNSEILKMTDHFTDDLFDIALPGFETIKFPVSRLLVDPERFVSDADEVMSKVGMGCIYEKTHDGKALKESSQIRNELIKRYYEPHHSFFSKIVDGKLRLNSKVLIVDCHSFPKKPLPYELNQNPDRAEICIGTDEFHTPRNITEFLVKSFSEQGFSVSINKPFSGAIVPMKFYRTEASVRSVMIEVRRDIYMDEKTGEKTENFVLVYNKISKILTSLDSLE